MTDEHDAEMALRWKKLMEGRTVPDGSIVLKASDLFEKFGFADGDVLNELLEEAGYDFHAVRSVEHDMFETQSLFDAVLGTLVLRRLEGVLPLEAVDLMASAGHNPLRVADTSANRRTLEGRVFTASPEEILEIAAELAPGFVSTAGPTPG